MIVLEQLSKVYGVGAHATVVLDRLDFSIQTGEIFAVVGDSGAGKSTLAACVTLLERPSSGRIVVNGQELTRLPERELRIARRRIGTIFQSDGLSSRRTAAQNVALPLEYLGATATATRRRVAELLDRVGLATKANHYPHQLSGGQRQRVGIARALALRPAVLLSDEATSGLDPASTASIVALLKELRDELDLSILFITHEMDTVVQLADSVARLDRGRITESGSVVDLLRDPSSALGAALRPVRASAPGQVDAQRWLLRYVAADVPGDWLQLLTERLGSPVSLLGASIDELGRATVGHATVAIAAHAADGVVEGAAALGLAARLLDEERTVEDAAPVAASQAAEADDATRESATELVGSVA